MQTFSKDKVTICSQSPIIAELWCEDGLWFVSHKVLNVHAHGHSAMEAIKDFEYHIVYLWEYYQSLTEDQVVGEGKRLKQMFNEMFSESV